MALRRDLTTRLIHLSGAVPLSATRFIPRRSYMSSPDTASRGFFHRILQRRAINQSSSTSSETLPEFMSFPVGDKLREKLSEINIAGDRIRLDGLARPPATGLSVTPEYARKIARAAQVEKVKQSLRSVSDSAVPFSEFVQICGSACGGESRGLELAKLLDETATVIVCGNVVFLRPEQLAKSMERLVTESIALPNDPRRKELEELEKKKAEIDKRAETLVRRELYYGLGFLLAQTAAFMRLTFWELSWDVMEPICYFVTSLYFAVAYGFFLRTSREPSFEGFFGRRFRTKQSRLMQIYDFDLDKYTHLSKIFTLSEFTSLREQR